MRALGSATVREARREDLSRLLALLELLAVPGANADAAGDAPSERHRQMLERLIADPDVALLVLEDRGEVRGACTLYILNNLTHGARPFALVENVVVDAGVLGRGYGELLMAEAGRRANDAGCYKTVLLSNNGRPDAHRFYERIGFVNAHKGFTRYRDP